MDSWCGFSSHYLRPMCTGVQENKNSDLKSILCRNIVKVNVDL